MKTSPRKRANPPACCQCFHANVAEVPSGVWCPALAGHTSQFYKALSSRNVCSLFIFLTPINLTLWFICRLSFSCESQTCLSAMTHDANMYIVLHKSALLAFLRVKIYSPVFIALKNRPPVSQWKLFENDLAQTCKSSGVQSAFACKYSVSYQRRWRPALSWRACELL